MLDPVLDPLIEAAAEEMVDEDFVLAALVGDTVIAAAVGVTVWDVAVAVNSTAKAVSPVYFTVLPVLFVQSSGVLRS
jgi:type IV secretory pathway TrbD component